MLAAFLLTASVVVGAVYWHDRRSRVEVVPEPILPTPVSVMVRNNEVWVDGARVLGPSVLLEHYRGWFQEPNPAQEKLAPLLEVLSKVRADPRRDSRRILIELEPTTAAAVAIEAVNVLSGAELLRVGASVPASKLGPSAFFRLHSSRKNPRDLVLLVLWRNAIEVTLNDATGVREVGQGCVVGAEGSVQRYSAEPNYEALRQCLLSLRKGLAPGLLLRAQVNVDAEVPAARFIYVLNTMRCGQIDCSEETPRLWPNVGFHAPQLRPYIARLMEQVRPGLHACGMAHRAELSMPAYEGMARVFLMEPPRAEIQPGLPPQLHRCAERAFAKVLSTSKARDVEAEGHRIRFTIEPSEPTR